MFNLKLALRTLLKTPFVTAVAALSLALGIGANTAIFSIFDLTLRRPLPVYQPERLVNISADTMGRVTNLADRHGLAQRAYTSATLAEAVSPGWM